MDQRHKPGMVLLSGNSHPGLAEEVARHLGVGVGSCLVYHNTNRSNSLSITWRVSIFTCPNISNIYVCFHYQGDHG